MFFFHAAMQANVFSIEKTHQNILFWWEIHSFVSINIATKHPRALICVYNWIGRTHLITKVSGTIACKTGSLFVQFISRDISQATNALTFATRNSILETQSSRLDTQNYRGSGIKSQGSRIKARGTVNLLLSGTVASSSEQFPDWETEVASIR